MGAGWTIKQEKRNDISVVIAGDGSVNQGMFHEAMNMISVFELPVLVVVENNLYGEFTSIDRHSAVEEIYKRAEAYHLEAYRIGGNDVKQVYETVGKIIERIRQDGKPQLVELMTYHWHGRMEVDPPVLSNRGRKGTVQRARPDCPDEPSHDRLRHDSRRTN
jgi:TPP-dependent pyruvate/acetoin dehydrogenase alpha subunit